MAVIPPLISINNDTHLKNTLEYIQREAKTMDGLLVSAVGCFPWTAYDEFKRVRDLCVVCGKNGESNLAYDAIQSFKADEVDIDTAHEIAKEWARQAFPNYQYVVATHIDRGHIHSHIVFNAFNEVTGLKYNGNKATKAVLKDINDKICLQHGLSIIDDPKGLATIDKTTYYLATQGISWKVALTNDIDKALVVCSNKAEFVRFLEELNYRVVWSDRNISITKIGEKKAVRVDNLARQFGVEYTKENIELALEGKEINPNSLPKLKTQKADYRNSEWSKYERVCFKSRDYLPTYNKSDVSRILTLHRKVDYSMSLVPLVVRAAWLSRERANNPQAAAIADNIRARWVRGGGGNEQPPTLLKFSKWIKAQPVKVGFGNVALDTITTVAGDCISVKVTAEQKQALRGANFFYAGEVNKDGEYLVTIKETNREALAAVLGCRAAEVKDCKPKRFGSVDYKRLRAIEGETLTININEKQRAALEASNAAYSGYITSSGKILISYKAAGAEAISKVIGKDAGANAARRKDIRTKAANRDELTCSVDVTEEQASKLKAFGLSVAVYRYDGKIKAEFAECELKDVCEVCGIDYKTKLAEVEAVRQKHEYRNLKITAAHTGDAVIYRVIDNNAVAKLRAAGLWFVSYDKDGKYNVAFRESDLPKYNAALRKELKEQEAANAEQQQQQQEEFERGQREKSR